MSMSIVGDCRVAIQTTTDGFYSPLPGEQDIRLLEVLPGDDESTLVTSLVTVSLNSKPTYAALSYAWGDAMQTSIIECNGKSISITTTLANALKAFRSFSAGPDTPLKRFQKIWADQLCINQHNVLERNHQVGIMGLVYSNSACVFIWLGFGDEDSDLALSFIDFLHGLYVKYIADDSSNDDGVDSLEDVILRSDNQAWVELEALMNRPWFSRCWTLQEPILAPERMLACGSKLRDWNTWVCASFTCRELPSMDPATADMIPVLLIDLFIGTNPENLHLSDLIYYNWQREATDPRDKVYALYGLVQGYQQVPLEINYAISVEDVYRSAVKYCIENDGNLAVLGHVSRFETQSDQSSWVPDWRALSLSGCNPVCVSSRDGSFQASSACRPLLVPSSSNSQLILKGFTLSIIERNIDIAALRFSAANSSPESWITNAAAAGVPACFLQGKTFQTKYDLTTMMEQSPFHPSVSRYIQSRLWQNSTSWFSAGSPDPMPQAVFSEYNEAFNLNTDGRCLFLIKDSLGLAPEPTQVGDVVCILLGGAVPFILRPRQNTASSTPSQGATSERQSVGKNAPQGITESRHQGSRENARVAKHALEATEWTLIGECNLHDFMQGEAMKMVTEDDYMNFALV